MDADPRREQHTMLQRDCEAVLVGADGGPGVPSRQPGGSVARRPRKVAQLDDARRRVTRIVDFVARGKAEASAALAETLVETEALVDQLTVEVQALEHSRESVFRVPSLAWIQKRVSALREVLEQRTESSALLLRRLLGKIVLEPVHPASGRPYYVASTSLDALVLLEPPGPDPGMDSGANVLGWWTRQVDIRTLARMSVEVALRDSAPASRLSADRPRGGADARRGPLRPRDRSAFPRRRSHRRQGSALVQRGLTEPTVRARREVVLLVGLGH